MDWLGNNAISAMKKSLDYVWQKQRTTLENIANQETPGYKAKYVTFEDELGLRMAKFDTVKDPKKSAIAQQIDNAHISLHESTNESIRMDGNNVNPDLEQTELARSQIQYQYLIRQITDQFVRLRMVIDGK